MHFIYSHHSISDVTSTLLFISVVINKLRLRAWTSWTGMSVSSCIKFGWHLSASSSAEIDITLRHRSLKGNEGSWSDWPWLKSAVTPSNLLFPPFTAAPQMHLCLCLQNYQKRLSRAGVKLWPNWRFPLLCSGARLTYGAREARLSKNARANH